MNLQSPTIGGAILLGNNTPGWEPRALLFTTPLVLLRYAAGVSTLHTPGAPGSTPAFFRGEIPPLELLTEVLNLIARHVPPAAPTAPAPNFPVAVIAASYEFGRTFVPHEDCFPFAAELRDDEFFAAIFLDAFRPDGIGGTERIGYAGTIPEGWMAGGPELRTSPEGHVTPPVVPLPHAVRASTPLRPEWSIEEFQLRVERIHEYLRAGDIYQANLTARFGGTSAKAPEEVFDAGLAAGGASFAMTFLTPTGTVVSFSPELFLRRRGKHIETRPIKGSLRTGGRPADEAAATLRRSAKDRAEHVMIVDLERNDLGRLCEFGSVRVDPMMKVVAHPTILHLESTVSGTLRDGVTVADLFAALFPGGSVTGTPKRRAMEIIAELEGGPRGYYCGALGWIDCRGDCELNLPIRTAMFRPDGTLEFSAGGAIVADSDPAGEWQEVLDKCRFLEGTL